MAAKYKIMWLCNTLIPEMTTKCGIENFKAESWISAAYNKVKSKKEYELIYLFPYKKYVESENGKDKFVSYIQKNQYDYEESQVNEFKDYIKKYKPDVIHIFGTEYAHTYAMVQAADELKCVQKIVISIQGLVYICSLHYCAGLSDRVTHRYTFRDFLRRDRIIDQKYNFERRGKFEIAALEKVQHVIGRTDWDYATTHQINPNINYHFCSETLRTSFYANKWNLDSCEKHTIFVSQASYPLKGFHYMLEALKIILKFYPDTHIYTTGRNPMAVNFKQKIRQNGYNKYLNDLIIKNNLQDKVTFLGVLNEKEMCERYLKSHVFVSCSSIENSSNSIGEARILGMPVVASYVGGTRFVTQGEDGLCYQADAPYMLAYRVCQVFDNDEQAVKMGNMARQRALIEHNPEKNFQKLLEIYKEVQRA